jgi:spore coat polysaccharide biosynthesis predicted glycosyltransferase SpsG
MNKLIYLVDARIKCGVGNLRRVKSLSEHMKYTKNVFLVKADNKLIPNIGCKDKDEYYLLPETLDEQLSAIAEFYMAHRPKHLIADLFAGEYLNEPKELIKYYLDLQRKIKNLSLITIDDARMLDYQDSYSRLSIISNTAKPSLNIRQARLIGPNFTIFSKKILDAKSHSNQTKKYKFFVTFGGSDVTFDTYKVIQSLHYHNHATSPNRVKVVLGINLSDEYINKVKNFCEIAGYEFTFFYSDYFNDLVCSEFVICGEGSTKLDAVALGVPPIVISQYDHDSEPMKEFVGSGLSYYFGKAADFSAVSFSKHIDFVISDTVGYKEKRNKGMRTYDCMGAVRISRHIESL